MRIQKSASMVISGTVMLFAAVVLVFSSYAKINPEDIIGMWLFDEDDDKEFIDSSGNGRTGVANGGEPDWVEGKFGGALAFNGDGTRVHVEHDDALSLETYTVGLWFKKLASTGDWQAVVNKGNNDSLRNYAIHVQTADKARGIMDEDGERGAADGSGRVTGTTGFADDEWHHIAITYDRKEYKLYVDGKVEASKQASFAPDTNTSPFTIGAIMNGSKPVNGVIDEVVIFAFALEQEDIQRIMSIGLEEIAAGAPVIPSTKLPDTWGQIKADS